MDSVDEPTLRGFVNDHTDVSSMVPTDTEPLPPEGPDVEYKQSLDPTQAKDSLTLVKEIVAFANAGGGRIVVGVTDSGQPVGVPISAKSVWDPAKIGDLLDKFINPDHLEVRITKSYDLVPDGRMLVTIQIPQFNAPPLVLCKDGNSEGVDRPTFRRYSVFVRHNTKAEPARRSDYLKWREDMRDRILQQFQMVVKAPESAYLRMIDESEVRDETGYLLSHAVDLFRQRPEKLLDGADLLYLFQNRGQIDYSVEDVVNLLIHSALRRKATLFFWLAFAGVDSSQVASILRSALSMTDRDKSDMASAVPLVAGLYLSAGEYAKVIELMENSIYAHISKAATKFPNLKDARKTIADRRARSIKDLADYSDDQLISEAMILAKEQNTSRASWRMPNLGLEYLARRIENASNRKNHERG